MTKLQERGGEGKLYFPLFKLQNVRETLWDKLLQLRLLPIASHGIMHGSQGITCTSMFTKGFANMRGFLKTSSEFLAAATNPAVGIQKKAC